MRSLVSVVLVAVGIALFAWAALPAPPRADVPAVVTRLREVARLETLDAAVYRKVTYEPPPASSPSFAGQVLSWAKDSVAPARGRAIVFGDAHLGIDCAQLDEHHLLVEGDRVWVVLPPMQVSVELRAAETEVIGSNLDSAQTAQLLEQGRAELEQHVKADLGLRERARGATERALRAVLISAGFREVRFVDALPRRLSVSRSTPAPARSTAARG